MEFENLATAYMTLCRRHQDRILFRNEQITFGRAWEKAAAKALSLKRRGIQKGDVVILLAGNSVDWCCAFMAITAIGAAALPLDTNLPAAQYRAMAQSAGAKAAFVSGPFQNIFPDLEVFAVEDDPSGEADSAWPDASLGPDDIAALLFTSGTTGQPKIVALTHRNILSVALTCTRLEEYTPDDVTLAMLPLYHVYAFESTFMAPLVTGSSLVFQNSLKGPDIIRALADNPITIFPAAPQMWELFFDALAAKLRAQSKAKHRLFMFFLAAAPALTAVGLGFLPRKIFTPVHDVFGRKMRFFISGGAPLKKEYFTYYRTMGFYIMEGYGLTETTGPIAIPYFKDAAAGSVGPPIAGNAVKIKNAGPDGIGEIWLQGDAVMAGYYRNDQANREAFDDERFFNTQDLGYLDARGHIHITGRLKNVIVLDSGKNVYPEELELYFRKSPLIAEIAVFGRKIDGRETVYAVIVPSVKGADAYRRIREEIASLNKELPAYKTIGRFALSADPLPRNSTRKVLIDEVIRLLEAGVYQTDAAGAPVPRNILAGADARENQIIGVLSDKLGADVLYANETLADHRMDSLGLVELVVYLEDNLNLSVDMDQINPLMTFEELVRCLASCPERTGATLDDLILHSPVTTRTAAFFNPLNELFLLFIRAVSVVFWRLRVLHRERLLTDNVIIVANHQSLLDTPTMMNLIPFAERRRFYLIGKKEVALLGWFFAGAPVLFVDRTGNVAPALKAAADVLRSGRSLIIFPEGTRTRDGALGRFKSGAAYLARHLNKKIIPVTIRGAFDIMPPGKALPRFTGGREMELVVGAPVDPKDFASIEALTEHLRNVIAGQT